MFIASTSWYKKFSGIRSRLMAEKLRESLSGPMQLLDFGCGNFFTSIALHEMDESISITGIDVISDQNLEQKLLQKNGLQFLKYNGGKIPFDDDHFDAAIAVSVMHHTPDPEYYLRELKRVVKNTGCIVLIEEMYINFADRIWISMQDWLMNKMKKGVPVPLQFRSEAHYRKEFAKNGLDILTSSWVRPGFPFMHHYVFKLAVKK